MSTPMRALLLALITAAGCAKNVQRDQALAAANAARARGDYVGEALALRDACAFAPDDEKLCRRAGEAWRAAQGASQQAARASCTNLEPDLASVDRCLAAVNELRKLVPGDPEAAQLAEAAARQHLARCFADSPAWQTSIDAAVELVRCQEARAAQINLPVYRQQLWGARTNARDQLMQLADHHAYRDALGATYELVAASACLAPAPALVERARSARGAFVDRYRASIDLRAAMSPQLPGLCEATASALGDRAVCGAPKPGAPQITIVGDLTVAPVEHSAYETTESKDYVAGIITFENPDYQPAVNDERNARFARDTAESDFRRDESDCRSAESALSSASSRCSSSCPERDERDRACNRKSSSESIYRSRQSEWEGARSRLQSTPRLKEREDIRTATYTVTHHTWRAAWSAQLRNDGTTFTIGGATTTEDRETAGAPVAGVPSDPKTYPGNRWFVPGVRAQAAAQLAETVHAALGRRASDLALRCPAPLQWTNDWLDCWARVRFWAGEPAAGDALLAIVGPGPGSTTWQPLRCAGN